MCVAGSKLIQTVPVTESGQVQNSLVTICSGWTEVIPKCNPTDAYYGFSNYYCVSLRDVSCVSPGEGGKCYVCMTVFYGVPLF